MKVPERRIRPKFHVLVCTNQRSEGHPLPCCANVGGQEVADALRNAVSRAGMGGRIWITQTGCLTFCNPVGVTIVAYPEGRWFTEVTLEDVPAVLNAILGLTPGT